MKYLVIQKQSNETPIIFPEFISHYEIASVLNYKIISAGMCNVIEGKFRAWGYSVTLGKKSREEDEYLLNLMIALR